MSAHSSSSSFEHIDSSAMSASIRSVFSPSPAPSLRSRSPLSSRSSSLSPTTPSEHHPQFYINDEMVEFLVEGCLFRIHRFFLDRESKVFPKVSSLEKAPSAIELGPEVTRFEFESLLNFIYNGMHTRYTPSLSEWTALLSISTRFEMADIRNRAIAEIDKVRSTIEPIEQVMLAVTHNVSGWLPDAYTALCLRETPITLREMKQIGDETMVLVAEAREAILKAKLESRDLPREPRSVSPERAVSAQPEPCCAVNRDSWETCIIAPEPCGAGNYGSWEICATVPVSPKPKPKPIPSSNDSMARHIVDEVFWRKERELERLEKEKKMRGVREAKEKAARQLLELEEVLGESTRKSSEPSFPLPVDPWYVRGAGGAAGEPANEGIPSGKPRNLKKKK